MATKITSGSRPFHEFDAAGRHRIVILSSDGTFSYSEWFPVERIAVFQGMYAVAQSDIFPIGILRVREVPHYILT